MEPMYTTRQRVKHAVDLRLGALVDLDVDSAIRSGSRSVEGLLKRYFWPELATRYEDFPERGAGNTYSSIWLTRELAATPTAVTAGGSAVTTFLPRPDTGPPYGQLALNEGAWTPTTGLGLRSIAITGLWGYRDDTEPAGQLAEALDASETGVDVSNSAAVGVGDLIKIESERMAVTEADLLDTGVDTTASLAASQSITAIPVGDGTAVHRREIITIGTEQMYVLGIVGNTLSVRRAWSGSTLAAHNSGASVYAPRSLTVVRGAQGSTAASHSSATAIVRTVVPSLVERLTQAYAMVELLNAAAGYARTAGAGESEREVAGRQVKALEAQARASLRRPRGKWAV